MENDVITPCELAALIERTDTTPPIIIDCRSMADRYGSIIRTLIQSYHFPVTLSDLETLTTTADHSPPIILIANDNKNPLPSCSGTSFDLSKLTPVCSQSTSASLFCNYHHLFDYFKSHQRNVSVLSGGFETFSRLYPHLIDHTAAFTTTLSDTPTIALSNLKLDEQSIVDTVVDVEPLSISTPSRSVIPKLASQPRSKSLHRKFAPAPLVLTPKLDDDLSASEDGGCLSPVDQITKEPQLKYNSSNSVVEIIPYLFLGNADDSGNFDELKRNSIGYVLNVTPNLPNQFERKDFEISYLQIPINDHWSCDLGAFFPKAIEFIDEGRSKNKGVLVHCLAGISRSVTITVAYLMRHGQLTLDAAYDVVKRRKTNISPNFNFMGQLHEFEKELTKEFGTLHNEYESDSASNRTISSSTTSSSDGSEVLDHLSPLDDPPPARGGILTARKTLSSPCC